MLQGANSAPLKIIRKIEGSRLIEKWAHDAFNHRHIRGEWFEFDDRMLTWEPPQDLIRAEPAEARRRPMPPSRKRDIRADKKLLATIDRFLASTGMSETYFGFCAVNDGKFLGRVRTGGRVWPETEAKVREFIKNGGEAKPQKGARDTA